MDNSDVKNVVAMIDNETIVTTDRGDVHRFTYDYSFWSFDESSSNYASQLEVYKAIGQPLLAKVFEGYNACLLAYGPTGSGKSYR
jgi:Kinesin motor domain